MKKLTLLLILVSLVSCAAPIPSPTVVPTSAISSCDPTDVDKYSAIIMPVYTRWAEAIQKAYAAQPADLTTDITALQGIDSEFKGVFPPACLGELHKALLSVSDLHIKGFSARSSGEAEARVADYFARANAMLAVIASELMKITGKTQ